MTSSSSSSSTTSPSTSPPSPNSVATGINSNKNNKEVSSLSFSSIHDNNMTPSKTYYDMEETRSLILNVGVLTGQLCLLANTKFCNKIYNDNEVITTMADLLIALVQTSKSIPNMDLTNAIRGKLALNKRKYPVELCKGRAGKYTQYSKVTGITTTNQSLEDTFQQSNDDTEKEQFVMLDPMRIVSEIPNLTNEIVEFATARQWAQYHTPRNIALALLGEVGELSELLQWKEQLPNKPPEEFTDTLVDKLGQELADVSIYLLRLASVCNVTVEMQQFVEKGLNEGK